MTAPVSADTCVCGTCVTGTVKELTDGPTMLLNMELEGDRGEPGTATVIVVSCIGNPSPSLIVSVAIFY